MNEVKNELDNLYSRINKEKNRRKYSKGFEDNVRRIIADINLLSDITESKLKSLSKNKIPLTLELDWVDPGHIHMLVESGYDSFEIDNQVKDYEYEDEDYERVFKQLKNAINECDNVVRLALKELKLIKSNNQVIKTRKNQEKTENQNLSERLIQNQEKSNKDNKDGMTIFISHISEESEYAGIIKRYLEDKFPNKINIFVFTDVDSIQLGSQWFKRIETGIQKSVIMLTLCSGVSVSRPWINFEAGAFWFKNMMQREFLIPVILPGYSKNELPPPLSFLQAIELDNKNDLKKLFSQIAKIIKTNIPEIEYSKLIEEISTIKVQYKSKESKKTQDNALEKLKLEINSNKNTMENYSSLKFKLSDSTLSQLLNSGDINKLSKSLIDEISMYSGEINLFNQTVNRSEGVSTQLKGILVNRMANILEIIRKEQNKHL